MDEVLIERPGLVPYQEARALQKRLESARQADEIPDVLLLLEHPPVYTKGRRTDPAELGMGEDWYRMQGIKVCETDRGGRVTYHGPGQLVGYPIVKLRARGLSVPCYVRALELAIIGSLQQVGIEAGIDEAHVGVWTTGGKIAAIGVAQRHGVTLHGFAVNLQPDLSHFGLINPCGIGELGVTSAAAILGQPVDLADFKRGIARAVEEQLERMSLASCAPARVTAMG
jgi:lipoyl(octanoyl) transferase